MVSGNLELVEYALKERIPHNPRACCIAAFTSLQGHVDVLKFLRSKGFAWCQQTIEFDCLGGHLKCLKYALENGYPSCAITTELCAMGDIEQQHDGTHSHSHHVRILENQIFSP